MGLLDSLKGLFGKDKDVADVNNDGQVNAADASAAIGNAQEAAGNLQETAGNAVDAAKDKLPQ